MGNSALTRLGRRCCGPQDADADADVAVPKPVSALIRDIQNFDATGHVPEGLSQYVSTGKKAQQNWYNKISKAWKEAQVPPRNADEAAKLIVEALQRHRKADVQGILRYYGLSESAESFPIDGVSPPKVPTPKYELRTLQVNAKDVSDGDTIVIYVDTRDSRESANVPRAVKQAVADRRNARGRKDFATADVLRKTIEDAGYRVFDGNGSGHDTLARKYKVRLRGVDAPESKMPYGKEAKEQLQEIIVGKTLRLAVYDLDQYGRTVADVYVENARGHDIFVQEILLKKGAVWHYAAYDRRQELAIWEKEARAANVGLWGAVKDPQKPWEWRKQNKRRERVAGA